MFKLIKLPITDQNELNGIKNYFKSKEEELKKIITIENYDFIFTDKNLYLRGFEMIELKSKNIIYHIFSIKNHEQVKEVFIQLTKDNEKLKDKIIIDEKQLYAVSIFGLKELRKFTYTETLNTYSIYFNDKFNALTAITILEEARYAGYNYERFLESHNESYNAKTTESK